MTAFIIATFVYFILSLGLSLLNMAVNANKDGNGSALLASLINVLISLGFITWGIILLAS